MPESLPTNATVSHYRILQKLGAGGMGEVYLAEDTRLDRKVALKLLPSEFTKDEDRVRRFIQEAKAASALNHPNIITIYEIGQEKRTHFIANELVEGETLRQRLSHSSLSLNESLRIAIQVADALAAAHKAGIIHRDIKPENIMIRPDALVKVLDFGLAKLTAPRGLTTDTEAPTKAMVNTAAGIVVGTANYMSPEQAKGVHVDARTDIWSLGTVLYEMVTGRAAFRGETPTETISLILQKDVAPLTRFALDVPGELERIVTKALTKEREERYQTTKDLLIDLRALKRKLEVAAEIDRIGSPETRSGLPPGNGQAACDTGSAPMPTAPSIPHASSAEYVVTFIRKHKVAAVAVAVLLLISVAGVILSLRPPTNAVPIKSIAVLPFENASGNPDVEYLSDGMTETLINGLAELPNLNVKARSSVFRYKGKEIELPKIGQELNVQAILTGRIVQRGENLTLNWDLVDAKSEIHLAGGQYNRRLADVVALQGEIARDVARKLGSRLSGPDEQKLTNTYTANPEAYHLYLKGRFHTLKNTRSGHLRAIPYLEKAIELDPNYALAYVGLADANRGLALGGEMRPTEYFPKARAAAEKALEIDGNLAEAHSILGFIAFWSRDWSIAESECKRAMELDPESSDAHISYANILSTTGRHQEALAEANRASELEPVNPRNLTLAASFYIWAGEPDEALSKLDKVFELDPNYWFAHQFAAQAYLDKGQFSEAEASARKAIQSNDENTRLNSYLAYAMARSGKQGEARAELEKLLKLSTERYVSPVNVAILYMGLGERSEALKWLERGFEEKDPRILFMKVEPKYNSLHNEPRFQELLRRVGFPE